MANCKKVKVPKRTGLRSQKVCSVQQKSSAAESDTDDWWDTMDSEGEYTAQGACLKDQGGPTTDHLKSSGVSDLTKLLGSFSPPSKTIKRGFFMSYWI
ncbi:hypothetical protein AOLI_G00276630 [Acnodon oligacanthus]